MRRAEPMMNLDLIHKALANPFRREVLEWLKRPDESFTHRVAGPQHGVPSTAIQTRSGLSQSTVSAHLAALTQAGLLMSERIGQWTFFSRNEATIRAFATEINAHL
jgi:DNA-binding transcriptional ArsR family regulator